MDLAIIGATGLVGNKILELIDEKKLSLTKVITAASESSKNKILSLNSKKYTLCTIEEALKANPQIAIFSAGSDVSEQWAPIFAKKGVYVIDNSSFWRMNPQIKLIVPEVNINILTKNDKIIANPNCSTIQLVVILKPLHDKFKIKRVVVSTYQSVSGSGKNGIEQLLKERKNNNTSVSSHFPHQIDLNVIPHIDDFIENGYTKEEMKIINETKKILDDYTIKVTATAVRIPVLIAHSESVNIEFYNNFEVEELKKVLSNAKGVTCKDDITQNEYPMPINSSNIDLVNVGRIRKDLDLPNTINLWISADNLRKGAATNALQIAEYLKNYII